MVDAKSPRDATNCHTNLEITEKNPKQPVTPVPSYEEEYRMVALDLDGTLLRSDRTISDKTVDYIRKMSQRGILIAVCTGRSAQNAFPHIQRLNLTGPVPVVCINGAEGMLVLDSNNQKRNRPLFRKPLSESAVHTITRMAKSLNYVTVWYYDNATYAYVSNRSHVQLVKLFERLTKSKISIISDKNNGDKFHSFENRVPPSRIVVLFLDSNVRKVAATFESALDGQAYVVPGSKTLYIEILSADVHKGRGLQDLCRSLQIPLSTCVAVGDGDNDREFLNMAGLGICMKNGSARSKAAADIVTDYTNDEDGVIKALKHLEESGRLQFSETTHGDLSWLQ